MGFFSSLAKVANPFTAVKNTKELLSPGGSVLGKARNQINEMPLGKPVTKSITNVDSYAKFQANRQAGVLADKLGMGGGYGAKFRQGQMDTYDRSKRSEEDRFISGAKSAGTTMAAMYGAPMAFTAAGGGLAGGAASGAVVGGANAAAQGQGTENTLKGAGLGALTGAATAGMGPPTSTLEAAGQGAVKGAITGAASGNSVANSAIAGAAGGAANSATGSAIAGMGGDKTLANIIGGYVAGQAAGAVGSALTGGQRGGQSMPTQQVGPDGQPIQNQGQLDLGSIVGGAGSLYQGYENAKNINGQLDNLNSLFAPNSPYAQQMEQKLARADAASGRRSQYGTRAVELQARLAEQAARLAPTIAGLNDQKNKNLNSTVNSGLGALQQSGILNSLVKQFPSIAQYFKGMGTGGMPSTTQDYYGGVGGVDTNPNFGGSGDPYNEGGYYEPSVPDWYSQDLDFEG